MNKQEIHKAIQFAKEQGRKQALAEIKMWLKKNTKGLELIPESKECYIFSYNDILEIIDSIERGNKQ
jgi:hypothetical protein